PVHGRRLRQQAAARPRRADLRAARQAGGRAGQADARSQGRTSRHRQPTVRGGEKQGGGLGRRGGDPGRSRGRGDRRARPRGGAAAGFPLPYIYQITNRRRAHKDVFINTGLQRPMRAPGHPQGSFITEIMMDELADLVKMDPVEFRIKNLPPEAANAMWATYLREGAEAFGWSKRHPTGDTTPGSIKTGMGV